MSATPDVETMVSTVRGAAKRVTAAKRTVAEVLVAARGHLTADEITSAVQRERPEVSPSTIYRILEEFEELELVVHAHLGQPAAVYHLAGVVHGHLTCEVCQRTVEIPSSHFDALSRELLARYGFQLDRHHLALSGRCRDCRNARAGVVTPREATT
ncbi:MAG: transcriptional repressor [Acidobacteriota bacterium]|nr:transcriptional repressor [Acidobacteriota bacterium]MDE3043699.1 transcriptional repressor [Acidobacteriota bacterium]MDE3223135.1 transcriptional repressor [Acidobacteriota bacterium]